MRIQARRYADLVYHVLAHVPVDVAASAWDPPYAAWARAHIGPIEERPLGEDARALAFLAPTHDTLARAQLLAWLFVDLEKASACWERALGELAPDDVDDPAVLRSTRGDPAAELLWCAAALEAEAHARLPPMSEDLPLEGVRALRDVAPNIGEFDLGVVRALRLRGRVRRREIWVGEPTGDPTPEHVAWQAAHEAAAVELSEKHPRLPFASVEHGSVVLLAMRAERAGRRAEHDRWLARLRSPDPRPESLPPKLRAIVEDLYFLT